MGLLVAITKISRTVAVVGRERATKIFMFLTFKICEYVTLHGKRDFADVVQFEMGRLSWIIQLGSI